MFSAVAQIRRSTRERRSLLPFDAESCVNSFSPVTRRKSIAPGAVDDLNGSKVVMTPKTPLVMSQEPKTPVSAPALTNSANGPTPKTIHCNLFMAKIQKDLNSPSALARVRAKKALKSPNFRNLIYGQFDVPHERQDIITADERKSLKPKSVQEVFANCKIYVEVRTGDDNRSAGIKNRLLRDGITVNEKLYKDTTHVVFKDGLLSTFKNAVKLGIPVTTILWIESCASQRRLVDPEKFKISNLDRYERPELYKRMRRQKSMQPEVSKLVFKQSHKALTQDKSPSHFDDETDMDEDKAALMELTLQNEQTVIESLGEQTLCESMNAVDIEVVSDGLDKWNRNFRRFTTFTPNPMEQTGLVTKSAVVARRTVFTAPQRNESEETVSTPEGFSANSSKTVVFNSTNKISKASRRSVFDISMNILELNCKAISEQKLNPLRFPQSQGIQTPTQALKPSMIRKRKLFIDDLDEIDECKENHGREHDVSMKKINKKTKPDKTRLPAYNTPQMTTKPKLKVDRRQTLGCFKPDKPRELAPLKAKTPVKPIASPKMIVCTNMSSSDKLIMQAAINKLGGKVENEVSSKTTHVVTPNDDRTMNVLRGVIQACVIVNVNWIHDSIAQNKWLETSMYQRDICDSNRVYERSVLGTKNYKNMTFANRGFFFLNNDTIDSLKKVGYLKEIIALCGGKITESISEANIVVSDSPLINVNDQQVVVISTYIFDSAMKGTWLEVSRYSPKIAKA